MVEEENGIKSGNFDNRHVTGTERVVDTIVQSFEISNLSATALVAPLVKWLPDCEQLVDHVTVVWLLRSDALVYFVILALWAGIFSLGRQTDGSRVVSVFVVALCKIREETIKTGPNSQAGSHPDSWDERYIDTRDWESPNGFHSDTRRRLSRDEDFLA